MSSCKQAVETYKALVTEFAETGSASNELLNFSVDSSDWSIENRELWHRIYIGRNIIALHEVHCTQCQDVNRQTTQLSLGWIERYQTVTYGELYVEYYGSYTSNSSGISARIILKPDDTVIVIAPSELQKNIKAHLKNNKNVHGANMFPREWNNHLLDKDSPKKRHIFSCEI